MSKIQTFCVATALAIAPGLFAQNVTQWEVGAAGGFGYTTTKDVKLQDAKATAGFSPGLVVTGFVGHNNHRYVGGEIRYTFQKHNMKVSSGGEKARFGAQSQAVHYDVLIHSRPLGSRVRPFLAVGGGVRYFQGTGAEKTFQPLSDFAILTKTNQAKGMFSLGGGVKWQMGERMLFRLEARDYVSQLPTNLITPGRRASLSGWIHNIAPMVGISYTF